MTNKRARKLAELKRALTKCQGSFTRTLYENEKFIYALLQYLFQYRIANVRCL